jgi:ribosome-associated protein
VIRITDTLSIAERELQERFVRASGPGGQNVNKVATAVELRFDIARSSLPDEIKVRLRRIAGARVTSEDVLVIDSRAHRTQGQNREAARERLVALLQRAARRPRVRRATRVPKSANEERLVLKKRRSSVKAARVSRSGDE